MTTLFLKVKHWQLFLVLIVLPIAVQFYWLSTFSSIQESVSEPNFDNESFTQVINEQYYQIDPFPYSMIVFGFLFFAWYWSIATRLQKKIPATVKMKIKKFKILFFIPASYMLCLLLFLSGFFSGKGQNDFLNSGAIIAVIFLLHLFSMFCIFYTIYFVAKTIKTVELQREVEFGNFIGEFFLLWFYFIGIWIIQPKINRLYKE